MNRLRSFTGCGLFALVLSGCAPLSRVDLSQWPNASEISLPPTSDSPSSETDPDSEGKVANPPATTLRFDGRETVLGTAERTQIATTQFCDELSELLHEEKYFSASLLVDKNRGVAEQVLWERYPDTRDRLVLFIADALSSEIEPSISWNGLLASLESQTENGRKYQQARRDFVDTLKLEEPSEEASERLRLIAQRLHYPLAMVDALRLLGLRELVASRYGQAESLFLQAAESADQHGDLARAAELWLMVATTASRAERVSEAENAWLKSVQRQLDLQRASHRPLDASFWMRVDEQRPAVVRWPPQTSESLAPFCRSVGCNISPQSPPELSLWCAVAATQYHNAEPQLALVNFKKAEILARGDDVMWLRIAQGQCLAALGQGQAAAALLSEPAASENPSIAMASTAAIGSAKLQAGAYQQGAELINKALQESAEANWPTRSQAEADLALAQLIIGDTDQGLEALHAAQAKFQLQDDRVSLLQSLENELRILELEGRSEEARTVAQKIRDIERA